MTYITPVVFTMIVHPLKKYVYMRYMHVIYPQKLVSIVYVYIYKEKEDAYKPPQHLELCNSTSPRNAKLPKNNLGDFLNCKLSVSGEISTNIVSHNSLWLPSPVKIESCEMAQMPIQKGGHHHVGVMTSTNVG